MEVEFKSQYQKKKERKKKNEAHYLTAPFPLPHEGPAKRQPLADQAESPHQSPLVLDGD
jgi:hypothetical protein